MANKGEDALGYVGSEFKYDGRFGPPLKLGLGECPIGTAPELVEALAIRNPGEDLSHYPDDPFHREAAQTLISGIGLQNLQTESVMFHGNGSYGAGGEVLRYITLKREMGPLLVPNYSFPNVKQWAIWSGNDYQPIDSEELNPESALISLLNLQQNQLRNAIVYIDYPNNPFGYANPELVRELIAKVSSSGGMPILDMAFGEVLGDEFRAALQFVHDYGGIGLGSLTKTQGVARFRAGYAILPDDLINNGYSGGERQVFSLNGEAEFAMKFLFQQDDNGTLAKRHADDAANYNQHTNDQLYDALISMGLVVGPTDSRVPIQTIISSHNNFYQRLATVGIETESLSDYGDSLNRPNEGYGHSAVRMLTPRNGELGPTVDRIALALR